MDPASEDLIKKEPNEITLAAHQEALEGGGSSYDSMEEFWADMEIERSPEPKS